MKAAKRPPMRDELVKRVILIACALAFVGGALMLLGGVGLPGGPPEPDEGGKAGDASELLIDLPAGLAYEPLPADVRRRLAASIEESVSDGEADVEARRIVRGSDGATGVAAGIATGFDEDIAATVREDSNVRRESIGGTRFLVGPTGGGQVAFRIDSKREAVAIYAANQADLLEFAEPFAR